MAQPDSGQARTVAPAPTQVLTPTVTPTLTATATATPRPSCAPRPPVRVTTARGEPGTLIAGIASEAGSGAPNNALESVQVTGLANARAEIGGRTLVGGESVRLPADTRAATLVVRRDAPDAGATVRLVVTDACGAWPTFVGGGPGAF